MTTGCGMGAMGESDVSISDGRHPTGACVARRATPSNAGARTSARRFRIRKCGMSAPSQDLEFISDGVAAGLNRILRRIVLTALRSHDYKALAGREIRKAQFSRFSC